MRFIFIVGVFIAITCWGCKRDNIYTDSMLLFYHYNCDGHESYDIISDSSVNVSSLIKEYSSDYTYAFNYEYLNANGKILIISPNSYRRLSRYIRQNRRKLIDENDIHNSCPYIFNVKLLSNNKILGAQYSFNSTIRLLDDIKKFVDKEDFNEKPQLSNFFTSLKQRSIELR